MILEFILGYSIPDLEDENEILERLRVLALAVLGHHGKPINESASRELKLYTERHNEEASKQFIQELLGLFKPSIDSDMLISDDLLARLKQVSWHLAGLTILADWLGSNADFFPYESQMMSLDDYWVRAQKQAYDVLEKTDVWQPIEIQPFLSVKEHYGFEPTPLQQWAESVEINDSPQLFILEDITGAGKTEAALVLTHRLMCAGAANGFYFGLPTMATSNAMFSRVSNHYLQMLKTADGRKPSIVLAHGAREMNNLFKESVLPDGERDINYSSDDITATAQCNSWLADSRKKALLAPVGVGTVDQALLAVLPRRHQSLRLLGLNRKVLIFDEVHSADEYMFELLESLLKLHLHQGGSVILLTATLSKKQRQRLISIWSDSLQLSSQFIQNTSFPLATHVSVDAGLQEYALQSRLDLVREVPVSFLHTEDECINQVLDSIEKDKCVVWIRNTVDDALNAYQKIVNRLGNSDNCLLFHSRFILADRKRIEEKVLHIYGKGSDNELRKGAVLIATQVFQESLDADTDIMISDICPIDDLIQRAGRLHRHTRNKDGVYESGIVDQRSTPSIFIHAPVWQADPKENWLADSFQSTEYVYRSPGRLWLGMKVLKELGALRMPQEARQLIESVYSENALDTIPQSFDDKEQKYLGEGKGKAAKAQSGAINWRDYGYNYRSAPAWYEDVTDISTRYSDIETVEVVLLSLDEQGQFEFYKKDKHFSKALSTVKLAKKKYADHLQLVGDDDIRLKDLKIKNPKLGFSYLYLWDVEHDTNYGYDSCFGVYELKEESR